MEILVDDEIHPGMWLTVDKSLVLVLNLSI